MARDYDMIVIGGGPSGSTVATLVAGAGHRVLVIDREHFPRFRIGESLMPATYWTLDRLGVREKMEKSHFVKKQSVQFYSKDGRGATPFYFPEFDPHPSSHTFQVVRAKFDQMLLENAREKGAEVRHGSNVTEILTDGVDAYVQTVIRDDLVKLIPVEMLQDILDYHSSVEQAARTAARNGVERLVLTHMVPAPTPEQYPEWRAIAADHFDGEIVIGDDLTTITI